MVVNNAGFTHLATIEEMSDTDAREEFDINVFGLLIVIRSVLPTMRKQQSGHITDRWEYRSQVEMQGF